MPQSPAMPASPSPTPARGLWRGALGFAFAAFLGGGLLYPLAGVGLGQALFAHAANGSLIERSGRVLGSTLVAQPFEAARYFRPRPSAAGFNPMAAAGSNQARTHPELRPRIETDRAAVAAREGIEPAAVPADLITQSASGLDPHISPAAAAVQVARVAQARGLSTDEVRALVERHTAVPPPGLPGEPHVNVLMLNLALDDLPRTARIP